MPNIRLFVFFFIGVLLDVVIEAKECSSVPDHSNSDFHSQAFIQSDQEVKLMIHGVPVNLPSESFNNLGFEGGKVPASPVRFEPPYLDFNENPVGQPHLEQVTLINPSSEKTVHLLSISATTPYFHCSFFHDKVVTGGGNTTFDVVFLAREVGNVENTLFIHTSKGTYKYQVFGVGIPSPYRLQPFIGAKIPVNTSFAPYINLYNPHHYTLQITEMYTSGGDLHLELPNRVVEAPRKLWEIPPYETRTVMRLRMVGQRPANNSGFLRILTNLTVDRGAGMVVPVEVQVSNAPGIFCTMDRLDFEIMTTLDNPKTMKLVLINAANKPLYITSVELDHPADTVSIDFRPVKILPGVSRQSLVALITFSSGKVRATRQWTGNIIVRTKNDEFTLQVPYMADVRHGSLLYDANNTKFFSGEGNKNATRHILITNTFDSDVVLSEISLQGEALKFFTVLNFTSPVIIKPNESIVPFILLFNPRGLSAQFISQMAIFTNVSIFVIRLFVYHGRLTVVPHRPELYKGHLDFGTLGVKESRFLTFTLRNENPLEVHISNITPNWEHAKLELLGVERGNGTTLTRIHDTALLKPSPLVLKPYHFAVFSVTVIAPDSEGVFASDVKIDTQFESLSIPYYMRTAEGSLTASPDTVSLDSNFPGKKSITNLDIQSTFHDFMVLKTVIFQPNDTRLLFLPAGRRSMPIPLKPRDSTNVGSIAFDPSLACSDPFLESVPTSIRASKHNKDTKKALVRLLPPCYTGFSTASQVGQTWLNSFTLDRSVSDIDGAVLTRLRQAWETTQMGDGHVVNTTLLLDTNQIPGFLSKIQARLVWPQLMTTRRLDFGLVQLGNVTVRDLVVENSGDRPLVVQMVPLSVYPHPSSLVELMGYSETDLEMDNPDLFSVRESTGNYQLESQFGIRVHRESNSLLLPPRSNYTFHVRFTPLDPTVEKSSSLLVLRNNLTGLETVLVSGRGGQGLVVVGQVTPEDTNFLLFELTERHLRNCQKAGQIKGSSFSFTVRRPFVMHNSGQLPVLVQGFSFGPIRPSTSDPSTDPRAEDDTDGIEESEFLDCSGYGFEVPDCRTFYLAVNETRKLEVAFTPDFSLHRIQQVLRVHTNLGIPLNMTVQATLPPHMLNRCSHALARPDLEVFIWYIFCTVILLVAPLVVILAYCDADRLFAKDVCLRHRITTYPSNQPDASRIFDLRSLGASGDLQQLMAWTESGGEANGPDPDLEVTRRTVARMVLTSTVPRPQVQEAPVKRCWFHTLNHWMDQIKNLNFLSHRSVPEPPHDTHKQHSNHATTNGNVHGRPSPHKTEDTAPSTTRRKSISHDNSTKVPVASTSTVTTATANQQPTRLRGRQKGGSAANKGGAKGNAKTGQTSAHEKEGPRPESSVVRPDFEPIDFDPPMDGRGAKRGGKKGKKTAEEATVKRFVRQAEDSNSVSTDSGNEDKPDSDRNRLRTGSLSEGKGSPVSPGKERSASFDHKHADVDEDARLAGTVAMRLHQQKRGWRQHSNYNGASQADSGRAQVYNEGQPVDNHDPYQIAHDIVKQVVAQQSAGTVLRGPSLDFASDGSDSPAPLWDEISVSGPPEDDFGDLSERTHEFAHNTFSGEVPPPAQSSGNALWGSTIMGSEASCTSGPMSSSNWHDTSVYTPHSTYFSGADTIYSSPSMTGAYAASTAGYYPPGHNPNPMVPEAFELPKFTQGRRELMIEHERRGCQNQQPPQDHFNMGAGVGPHGFSPTSGANWDPANMLGSQPIPVSQWSSMNDGVWGPLVPTRPWDDAEPGSHEQEVLLPPGLLDNDSLPLDYSSTYYDPALWACDQNSLATANQSATNTSSTVTTTEYGRVFYPGGPPPDPSAQ